MKSKAKQRRPAQRMTLADQLRAAIAQSNRSEYEIALASGVSQGSLTRFMRGERDWTLGTADQVAEELGLELLGAARYAPAARPGAKRLPRRVPGSPATASADVDPELN